MVQKNRSVRKTSGAVLIMVVTIMFVLIVMLLATLSVVATARQRTYSKFEENQASFTTRSAIEFFISDLFANDDDNTSIDDPYYSSGTEKMTVARQVEMEMRTLKSLDIDGTAGLSQDQVDALYPDDPDYDTSLFVYDDNALYGLYKDDDSSPLTSPYNVYYPTGSSDTDDYYLQFSVKLPKASGGLDEYGKFADGDEGGGSATIKVEVLDRYFNFANDDSGNPDIRLGNRQKDVMKLRITATSTFNGYEAVSVIIVDTKAPVVSPDFTKSISSTSGVSASAKIKADGGVTALDDYTFKDNSLNGGVYVDGNFTIDSSGTFFLPEQMSLFATKDFNFTKACTVTTESDNAFIYAGDTFNTGNISPNIGTSTNPVDIICQNATISGGNLYSDIYCGNDMTINMAALTGDIYCNGTLTLGNTYFQAGTSDTGAVIYTIKTGSQAITGNIYANRIIAKTNDSSSVIIKDTSAGINLITSTNVFGSESSVVTQYATTDATGEYILPTNVGEQSDYLSVGGTRSLGDADSRVLTVTLPDSGSTKDFIFPTFEGEFPSYYEVEETTSGNGYKITDIITAEKKYYSDNNLPEPANASDYTLDQLTTYATFEDSTIKTSGILSPGNYSGYIQSGITLQLLAGGTYNFNLVATDDNSRINILLPAQSSATTTTMNGKIFSAELESILYGSPQTKNGIIKTGDIADVDADYCAPPNIYVYAGDNNNIYQSNNIYASPQQCAMNAYVYGPTIKFSTGNSGTSRATIYYGQYSPAIPGNIIGAAIVGEADFNNDGGAIYINPALSTPINKGQCMLSYIPVYYSNNVSAESI